MKRVCIVGAGMSGLCTCKYILQQGGMVPLVLEASGSVGGVWRSTYDSTVLQNSYSTYQFSDFPWPPSTPLHPSHCQVLAYFQAYAHHFNILPHIQFHSKLISLQHNPQSPQWIVTYISMQPNGDTTKKTMEFDFVVLCIGRFGDVPRLPTFSKPSDGPQIFGGKVLHAMHYSTLNKDEARELLQGKRVAVVGFHKSALDIAMEASEINNNKGNIASTETFLIYRRPYWFIPENSRWEAMLAFLYFTRFSELLHQKPGSGSGGLWDQFLHPLRWAISRFVEITLLYTLPLRVNGLIPDESFVNQMASCLIAKPPPLFFQRVEEGHIQLYKSPKWSFYEKGLVLDVKDGNSQVKLVEVDVVILATGYDSQAKLLQLIPEDYRYQLFDSNGVLPLYRGIIPCMIPNLAILGYQLNFANIHSSEMGARWLSHLLAGHFELPNPKEMRKEAQIMADYVRDSAFPGHSCLGLVQIWYADQLCKDIGWNPRRKPNFLQELFSPYTNLDYIEN